MTFQGFGVEVNGDLNITLAIIAAIVFFGLGHLYGRICARADATTEVQHALDRAARDVRMFKDNIYGTIPGSPPAKALVEAEQIVRWRTAPGNIETTPKGISRMQPRDIPRSRAARREQERQNQRDKIYALGSSNRRPDDTYAGTPREQMGRRYTRPQWAPKEPVDAEAP